MVSPDIPEGSVGPVGTKGKGRGKGGPKKGKKKTRAQEEEEEPKEEQEDEQEQDQEEEETSEGEGEEDDTTGGDSSVTVWQRGPSRLPQRLILVNLRPVIKPVAPR